MADSLPASEGDWSKVTLVNAPGENSYPIASFTYLLVYDDLSQTTKSIEEAKAVVHMIHWMITEGQNHSQSLLYVPLSDSVVELGKQGLAKIKYGDEILFDYSGTVPVNEKNESVDYEIPNWIRDNARWWADGLITDQDYISGLQYLISEGILTV